MSQGRIEFFWRMLLAFPRIMRLSYRVTIWNAGHSDNSLDAKLKRVPGGTAELNEIARYVMPEFRSIDEE